MLQLFAEFICFLILLTSEFICYFLSSWFVYWWDLNSGPSHNWKTCWELGTLEHSVLSGISLSYFSLQPSGIITVRSSDDSKGTLFSRHKRTDTYMNSQRICILYLLKRIPKPNTHIHIWIHSDHESMHVACTNSSQKKKISSWRRGNGHKVQPQRRSYLHQ